MRSQTKSIVIPVELSKKIDEVCGRYGVSKSEFIRWCIIKELENSFEGYGKKFE